MKRFEVGDIVGTLESAKNGTIMGIGQTGALLIRVNFGQVYQEFWKSPTDPTLFLVMKNPHNTIREFLS